jgi:hypothetical protein
LRRSDEVTLRNWDSAKVINYKIYVESLLRGDWDNWRTFSDCAGNKLLDVFVLLDTFLLIANDNVDFVLQDYDLIEVHNLDSGKMFTCLILRTRLISSNKKKSAIHDSSTSKHSCHKHIMTRAIDKGNMSPQKELTATVLAFCLVFLL